MHGTISAVERASVQALSPAAPSAASAGSTSRPVGRSVSPNDDPRRKAYVEG